MFKIKKIKNNTKVRKAPIYPGNGPKVRGTIPPRGGLPVANASGKPLHPANVAPIRFGTTTVPIQDTSKLPKIHKVR